MGKRERVGKRTALVTENPLEGEQIFLDAMFGASEEQPGRGQKPVRHENQLELRGVQLAETEVTSTAPKKVHTSPALEKGRVVRNGRRRSVSGSAVSQRT